MFTCHRLSPTNKLDCPHALGTNVVSPQRLKPLDICGTCIAAVNRYATQSPWRRPLGRLFVGVGLWVAEEILAELFELCGCLLDLLGAGIAERRQKSVVFFEQQAGILFDDCNLGASLVAGGRH